MAAKNDTWREEFSWAKGEKLEMSHKKSWYNCEVLEVSGGNVKIRYTGGSPEDDEWLEKDSIRLRPQQPELGEKKRGHGDGAEGLDRPLRRSRMISDDAKLAMKLQNEELKLSKSRPIEKLPPKISSASNSSASKVLSPTPSSKARVPAQKKVAVAKPVKATPAPAPAVRSVGKLAPKRGGGIGGVPVNRTASLGTSSAKKQTKDDPDGMTSFTLAPQDDSLASISGKGKVCKTMDEDTTVMQIKRLITEQINHGGSPSSLVLKVPGGLMLGNDHSLKYIRRFLYPPAKGPLDILYSKQQEGRGFL